MLVDYGGPSAATILDGDELFLLGHGVGDREPMENAFR